MERRFTSLDQVLQDLHQKQQNRSTESSKNPNELGEAEYNCPLCKDTELITFVKKGPNGYPYDYAKPCDCREKNAWKRRFKNSLIPEEFIHANFENYEKKTDIQKVLFQKTLDYLGEFKIVTNEFGEKKKTLSKHNLGFAAKFGEQRLKESPSNERALLKQKHNNFGIGKTHLQMALAKHLIKHGFNVLTVSDVSFMEDLMQAKKMNDDGETYNRLLHGALTADLLIWDDIGKVNWTEPRERMYYTIINGRDRKQLPIAFSTNEDRATLADKIGYAGASRLIGGCINGLFIEAEGEDYRLKKLS